MGIIVCGGNGSGKSTLGKELSVLLGYKFIDIEDYYFPKKDMDYKYDYSLSKDEVIKLLFKDIKETDDFVLASVRGDYGDEIVSKFTCAIFIDVPLEVRINRVKKRSFEKFGDRIIEGGDLYEKESRFFDMVLSRGNDYSEKWLGTLSCPIIRVDGTKPICYNIELIMEKLSVIKKC